MEAAKELYLGFPWMKDILTPGKSPSGRFELVQFELTKGFVEMEKMHCMMDGRYGEVAGLKAGTYMKLVDRELKEIWMSDTWMERVTSIPPATAKGKILVGGLGMGMQLKGFETRSDIEEVVVVEKEKELVEWLWPQLELDSRFFIYHDDVFEYTPDDMFDLIFMDIWPNIDEENLIGMRKLSYRYRKYVNKKVNPEARMEFWRRDKCRQLKRQSKRESFSFRW